MGMGKAEKGNGNGEHRLIKVQLVAQCVCVSVCVQSPGCAATPTESERQLSHTMPHTTQCNYVLSATGTSQIHWIQYNSHSRICRNETQPRHGRNLNLNVVRRVHINNPLIIIDLPTARESQQARELRFWLCLRGNFAIRAEQNLIQGFSYPQSREQSSLLSNYRAGGKLIKVLSQQI